MASNLFEILLELDTLLKTEEKSRLLALNEDQIMSLHFSLGLLIRNSFIHSRSSKLGKFLAEKSGNPDGVSTVISKCYLIHLRGQAITRELLTTLLYEHALFMHTDTEFYEFLDRMIGEKNE